MKTEILLLFVLIITLAISNLFWLSAVNSSDKKLTTTQRDIKGISIQLKHLNKASVEFCKKDLTLTLVDKYSALLTKYVAIGGIISTSEIKE